MDRNNLHLVYKSTYEFYILMGEDGETIPLVALQDRTKGADGRLITRVRKPESAEQYIIWFKRVQNKCCITPPKSEFVKLAQITLVLKSTYFLASKEVWGDGV